jgi:molybdenum cofactor cytidylyltransferase
MGCNKMLLTLEGESLSRRAARRAHAGGLSPVIVVLGAEAERAVPELEGLDCQIVINPRPESGMASSLAAGLEVVPSTAAAAMILLADMPFVSASMIAQMIQRYADTRAPLVISDYGGVTAPPTVFDRRCFAELLARTAGRAVVNRHRDVAEVLSWPVAAGTDIDRPEDYNALITRSRR